MADYKLKVIPYRIKKQSELPKQELPHIPICYNLENFRQRVRDTYANLKLKHDAKQTKG